jgi:hypothetical protein
MPRPRNSRRHTQELGTLAELNVTPLLDLAFVLQPIFIENLLDGRSGTNAGGDPRYLEELVNLVLPDGAQGECEHSLLGVVNLVESHSEFGSLSLTNLPEISYQQVLVILTAIRSKQTEAQVLQYIVRDKVIPHACAMLETSRFSLRVLYLPRSAIWMLSLV